MVIGDIWLPVGRSLKWEAFADHLHQRNFGRAAAVAWILFLVIVAFAVINFWLTSRIASSGGAKPAASRSRRKGVSR